MDWHCMVNSELKNIDSDYTNFFWQEMDFGWFKAPAAVWDTGRIFFTLIHPFLSLLCFPRMWTLINLGVSCTGGHKGDCSAADRFQEALLAHINMHKSLHINAHFRVAKLISGFLKNDWICWFLIPAQFPCPGSIRNLLSGRQRMVNICSGDILKPAGVKGVELCWGKKILWI